MTTIGTEFRDLFNGRDLAGWVNVNTADDTWRVKDGILICSGRPIGVMRSEKQYENFMLHIEWMHTEPGGNSGVFIWSNANPNPESRLPDGVEVQMLELDWPKLNTRDGRVPPIAYVHGELFGVGGVKTVPDNPRGERSMSIENRAKGRGEWNTYDVVAVDGVVKLSVNGVFVNGVSRSTQKKGYLCLESEGRGDPLPEHQDPGAAARRALTDRSRSLAAGHPSTDVAVVTPRTIASATTSAASVPTIVTLTSSRFSLRVETAKS